MHPFSIVPLIRLAAFVVRRIGVDTYCNRRAARNLPPRGRYHDVFDRQPATLAFILQASLHHIIRRQAAARIAAAVFNLNRRVIDAEAVMQLVRHAMQPIVIDLGVGPHEMDR